MQQPERARLHSLPVGPRPTLVSVDFETQVFGEQLRESGFKSAEETMFVMEGVSQYIAREALPDTLTFVGSLPKAMLLFTYIEAALLADPGGFEDGDASGLLQKFREQGKPWVSAYEPSEWAAALAAQGLRLTQDVGWEECMRHVLEPNGRAERPAKMERVITAVSSPEN